MEMNDKAKAAIEWLRKLRDDARSVWELNHPTRKQRFLDVSPDDAEALVAHYEAQRGEREARVEELQAAQERAELADFARKEAMAQMITMAREPERFDLVMHLHRQRAFSTHTFGPGPRTKGVVAHIRKELLEIESKPNDLEEWVDVVLLALDGAWRAGWLPDSIARAIEAKQTKNEGRTWPDWRTASPDAPIEHQRSAEEST